MQRQVGWSTGPRRGGHPPRSPTGSNLWWGLIRPALVIALLGGVAVVHLLACARLSTIEWDKQRLTRMLADADAQRAELRQELSEYCSPERILKHAEARGLRKPVRVVHVNVDEVPEALCAELPTAGSEELVAFVRVGQLPREAAGSTTPPPQALW